MSHTSSAFGPASGSARKPSAGVVYPGPKSDQRPPWRLKCSVLSSLNAPMRSSQTCLSTATAPGSMRSTLNEFASPRPRVDVAVPAGPGVKSCYLPACFRCEAFVRAGCCFTMATVKT